MKQGELAQFVNADQQANIRHSVTTCKYPCNGRYVSNYPWADGSWDSGHARLRPDRRRHPEPGRVDASRPEGRQVLVLLPHPSVHARRVPRSPVAQLAVACGDERSRASCSAVWRSRSPDAVADDDGGQQDATSPAARPTSRRTSRARSTTPPRRRSRTSPRPRAGRCRRSRTRSRPAARSDSRARCSRSGRTAWRSG